jgi:integrase
MFADELGRPIHPKTDWDRWKRLLTAADVRDGRLHDARHTAATMLLLLGVHERTIMSVLGWSTTAMASRYTHVTGVVQADLAARIDALLWSSSETGTETN